MERMQKEESGLVPGASAPIQLLRRRIHVKQAEIWSIFSSKCITFPACFMVLSTSKKRKKSITLSG